MTDQTEKRFKYRDPSDAIESLTECLMILTRHLSDRNLINPLELSDSVQDQSIYNTLHYEFDYGSDGARPFVLFSALLRNLCEEKGLIAPMDPNAPLLSYPPDK